MQSEALLQLLHSVRAWDVVIVVQIAGTAVGNIARGTVVVTTLQTESITAVISYLAQFLGRVLTIFLFRVCTSLSVRRKLSERGNFASVGLLESFMRVEARRSGCLGSSAAVVGAMNDEMVAVLRIVSLVVTDSWFQVRFIVLKSSGSGRDIVIILVVACLAVWNHAKGGGNVTADRRHRLGVKSTHLVVVAR